MRYLFTLAGCASLVAAHGYLKQYIVDGITYPAFDPLSTSTPKWNAKHADWGYTKRAPGPVDNVSSIDITCRFHPLKEPALEAVARAGSNITFKWTDWFTIHKGPLLTYIGSIEDEHVKPETVRFFKIGEAAYDTKTQTWSTDWLIAADNYHTVTIPADVKPGLYMVRHEIFSLHNALNDDWRTRVSGAQFYHLASV